MDRGTYTAASNGLAQLRKLEVVNNNLANVNTPGFKRQILVADKQNFDETLAKQFAKEDPYARGDHERSSGVVNLREITDFSEGPIKSTGNPLDVALRKPGQFFVIQTPEGEQYSRAGNFTLDVQGQLVTQDGMPVLGDGGAITADGPGAKITAGGNVKGDRGTDFGKVRVVEFVDTSKLQQVGGNRFKLVDGATPAATVEADLEPGSLEMSNVSLISSVVDLITTNRGFEAYTRITQSIDQINQAAITQVGRGR